MLKIQVSEKGKLECPRLGKEIEVEECLKHCAWGTSFDWGGGAEPIGGHPNRVHCSYEGGTHGS